MADVIDATDRAKQASAQPAEGRRTALVIKTA